MTTAFASYLGRQPIARQETAATLVLSWEIFSNKVASARRPLDIITVGS